MISSRRIQSVCTQASTQASCQMKKVLAWRSVALRGAKCFYRKVEEGKCMQEGVER
jgi:hypothetical protein